MITKFVLAAVLICSATAYDDSSGVEPFGITASGATTQWGIVACSGWSFGTQFVIEELGAFECQDRGGAILNQNQVDIWHPTYREAVEFGIRKRWCSIYVVVQYLARPSMRVRKR